MMAYHQRVSQFRSRIDFDDPSTTKPPSMAKSAVLQALEDEERQQSRAGKGLKRVAWPPPAEFGDGDYQHQQPAQQQQQPHHYPPQQQPTHQQPLQQNYPQQQQHQQHYQQPRTQPQQNQPRERIIPIQRATSHTSPLNTPKSPVNQLKYPSYPPSLPHQTPQYPVHQQQSPVGSSTVAFSGGRAVLSPKQQQHHQQPARPVSAPYYQQQQQQQQNRYSSPSTASLASPRSPQVIGSGGHSPRGWAHVQSPVPVYRPTPQQHQQQQPYVPPPFQTVPAPYQQQQRPTSAGAGYGHGYGPRKPEPSNQQPQYQPQPTQAFQPLVSAQNQQQLYQQPEADIPPQQQQQRQQFYHTTAADSQIPFVTTLRKEAPMSQEPNPVYQTEPVAAIYQGGTNMRGDQKWPPADYKKQSDLDNEERRKLAQQPAFRPKKVKKDYTEFFAKNALNATYPGYRAPPGTQHHS